jgi:hypothetical protein
MLSYIHTREPGNLVYVTKFGSLDVSPVDIEGVLEAIRQTYESNDALRTRYVRKRG